MIDELDYGVIPGVITPSWSNSWFNTDNIFKSNSKFRRVTRRKCWKIERIENTGFKIHLSKESKKLTRFLASGCDEVMMRAFCSHTVILSCPEATPREAGGGALHKLVIQTRDTLTNIIHSVHFSTTCFQFVCKASLDSQIPERGRQRQRILLKEAGKRTTSPN